MEDTIKGGQIALITIGGETFNVDGDKKIENSEKRKEEDRFGKLIEANLSFWKATRINGASASMCCQNMELDLRLIKAFDDIMSQKVEARA